MTSIYLDNVKDEIQRQIRWAGLIGDSKSTFLDEIINYCEKLKTKNIKKSSKTRHGSGREK